MVSMMAAKKQQSKLVLKISKTDLDCKFVEYYELDGVVQEYYDVVYEVMEQEKATTSNSMIAISGINGALSEQDKQSIKEFKKSKGSTPLSVRVILNDFVFNKLIEPGDYNILC